MNLLTNENPLIVLPQLACVIGQEEALVLQQLHFRLQQQTVKCGIASHTRPILSSLMKNIGEALKIV